MDSNSPKESSSQGMAELGLSRMEDVDENGNVQVARVVCSV